MNTVNACVFLLVGAVLGLLPWMVPAYFPASGADGSNGSALWLQVVGLLKTAWGGQHLVRVGLWPVLRRVLAWRPVLPAAMETLGLGRVGELAVRIGTWPLLAVLAPGQQDAPPEGLQPLDLIWRPLNPHEPLEPATEPHYRNTAAPGISEDQHCYRSMVAHLDAIVGALLAKLDALGIRDKTLVVFTYANQMNAQTWRERVIRHLVLTTGTERSATLPQASSASKPTPTPKP